MKKYLLLLLLSGLIRCALIDPCARVEALEYRVEYLSKKISNMNNDLLLASSNSEFLRKQEQIQSVEFELEQVLEELELAESECNKSNLAHK